MNKPYFLELTNKLYRLTFFFPVKEPLRQKIREIGDEVLSDLVVILEGEIPERRESAFRVEKNLQIIDALLELSKSQNWIDPEEIGKVQAKYKEIKKEVEDFNDILRRKTSFYEEKMNLEKEKPALREGEGKVFKKEEKKEKKPVKLNARQEKILQLLKESEKMQVKDFQKVLKTTTKRTLRRDLSALTDQKIIKRQGSGNMTYYHSADN